MSLWHRRRALLTPPEGGKTYIFSGGVTNQKLVTGWSEVDSNGLGNINCGTTIAAGAHSGTGYYAMVYAVSTSKIDITNYSTLHVRCNAAASATDTLTGFTSWFTSSSIPSFACYGEKYLGTGEDIISINLSNLTGTYYLFFGTRVLNQKNTAKTVSAWEIWLE